MGDWKFEEPAKRKNPRGNLKKAFECEKNCYGCSQCVLLAVQDVFGLESEEIFKAATGFAGGIGSKVLFVEH